MNILIIEPFYAGSHKSWIKQMIKHSDHDYETITMDGRFWKWRMYGSCVNMSERFNQSRYIPDLIITSDMMDLSTFISLSKEKLMKHRIPVLLYFHENQFAYPWQPESEDVRLRRDAHYSMINYTSALSADYIAFNSKYNYDTFYAGLQELMHQMPDYPHSPYVSLKEKSSILPIGIPNVMGAPEKNNPSPLILWNHRLEHDKNPGLFFKLMRQLDDEGLDFQMAFIGESNASAIQNFQRDLDALSHRIIAHGYLPYNEYVHWLDLADILPVTSSHDFFGISVMEAISHNVYPILPDNLSYPELYHLESNKEHFYDSYESLYLKTKNALLNIEETRQHSLRHLTNKYMWHTLIKTYDQFFTDCVKNFGNNLIS